MNLDNRFDQFVFHWVQAHLAQRPMLQYVCRDLTSLGGNVLIALITVFVGALLGLAGDWRNAFSLGSGVAFAGLLVALLKILIGRPCPLQPDPCQHLMRPLRGLGWLVSPCQCDFGGFPIPHLPCMPSGHTTASVFLYGILADMACRQWPEYSEWWLAWGLGLPVAIGLTRIVLSAHWTTDVLAGFGLGHLLLWGWKWLG